MAFFKDVNECLVDNKCDSSQDCINTVGSYKCSCKKGFQQDMITAACIGMLLNIVSFLKCNG